MQICERKSRWQREEPEQGPWDERMTVISRKGRVTNVPGAEGEKERVGEGNI